MKKIKIKIYSIAIIALYFGVLVFSVYLSKNNENADSVSKVINFAFFTVVGLLFLGALVRIFQIERVKEELLDAVNVIKDDATRFGNQDYLIDKYKKENVLFKGGVLETVFNSYLEEYKRLENDDMDGYKCDISNYINQELIDDYICKNKMNLIPGTMTGLGILGTFVGLAFGLQEFKTGSAELISDSIAPLMGGIKIAFHTSIYGMLYSLCFNFIFKGVSERTYKALDDFYDVFYKNVCPEADTENASVALEIGRSQNEIIKMIGSTMEENFVPYLKMMCENSVQMMEIQVKQKESIDQMHEAIETRFEKMTEAFDNFSANISDGQINLMQDLVQKFMQGMNDSLGDSFVKLGAILDETCKLQEQSNSYMQEVLNKVGSMALEIDKINEMSVQTIEGFTAYINDLEDLQGIMNDNFTSVNLQLDKNNETIQETQKYIAELVEYENRISGAAAKFTEDMVEQIAVLRSIKESLSESANEQLEIMLRKAEECSGRIADVAIEQIRKVSAVADSVSNSMDNASTELTRISNTLNTDLSKVLSDVVTTFDSELAIITERLSGTIKQVDETTSQVPSVVDEAYSGMRNSFDEWRDYMKNIIEEMKKITSKISEEK